MKRLDNFGRRAYDRYQGVAKSRVITKSFCGMHVLFRLGGQDLSGMSVCWTLQSNLHENLKKHQSPFIPITMPKFLPHSSIKAEGRAAIGERKEIKTGLDVAR